MMVTYEIAMAAGRDAANRQMRANDRTCWNEDDYKLAADTFHRLYQPEVRFGDCTERIIKRIEKARTKETQ